MKRASSGQSSVGTVSREDLRKAVLHIKAKRAGSAAKKSTRTFASSTPALIERYLGHFGVGNSSVSSPAGSATRAKTAKKAKVTKKAAAKKVASKSLHRAS
jgi:hypothetical protein